MDVILKQFTRSDLVSDQGCYSDALTRVKAKDKDPSCRGTSFSRYRSRKEFTQESVLVHCTDIFGQVITLKQELMNLETGSCSLFCPQKTRNKLTSVTFAYSNYPKELHENL